MSRTKLGLGLGLGLEMHKTINLHARRAAAKSPERMLWRLREGGHDIFGIPDPDMPIHYAAYIGLRRRLRVVYSRASPMLKPLTAYITCARRCDLDLCPFDFEQLSYMAGQVTNLATKLEDPTPIRS